MGEGRGGEGRGRGTKKAAVATPMPIARVDAMGCGNGCGGEERGFDWEDVGLL